MVGDGTPGFQVSGLHQLASTVGADRCSAPGAAPLGNGELGKRVPCPGAHHAARETGLLHGHTGQLEVTPEEVREFRRR